MTNNARIGLVSASWFGVVCSVIAAAVAMHAALSTIAVLAAAAMAPAGVAVLLGLSMPAPVMGVWLHGDGRKTRAS